MANYSVPQLLEKIKQPSAKNRSLLDRCSRQHNRAKFHVEPIDSLADVNQPALTNFLAWTQTLLPIDKFEYFKKYLRPPFCTVDITERAFTELTRSLEGENQYVRAEFASPENSTDYDAYLASIKEASFWLGKGVEAAKTQYNSVLIVDVERTQVIADKPRPYFYLIELNSEKILDVSFKEDGIADYILFFEGKNTLYAFDDSYFRVFTKPPEQDNSQFQLEHEVQHSVYDVNNKLISGLGYCPAKRFWSDNLTSGDTMQAKGPLSKVFGKLDEYLYKYTGLMYGEDTGTFAVVWQYADSEPKHIYPEDPSIVCKSGYFLVPQPDYINPLGISIAQKPRAYPCKECAKNKLTGPGTIKTVTPPDNKVDADLRDPMGYIVPPQEIIEKATERLEARKRSLIASITGSGAEPGTNQPRNEKDVEAGFEGLQSYLLRFKINFEIARKWTLETMAKLRYQNDFLRCTVDYGTEFYLRSELDITKAYQAKKEAGLPDYMLAPSRDLISQTEYRANDEQRMRQRILANLQPYPDRSDAELITWVASAPQMLNAIRLRLRLDFDSYVRRFEREQQMSIVDFGSQIDFNEKIKIIYSSLISYTTEDEAGSLPALAAPIAAPII